MKFFMYFLHAQLQWHIVNEHALCLNWCIFHKHRSWITNIVWCVHICNYRPQRNMIFDRLLNIWAEKKNASSIIVFAETNYCTAERWNSIRFACILSDRMFTLVVGYTVIWCFYVPIEWILSEKKQNKNNNQPQAIDFKRFATKTKWQSFLFIDESGFL